MRNQLLLSAADGYCINPFGLRSHFLGEPLKLAFFGLHEPKIRGVPGCKARKINQSCCMESNVVVQGQIISGQSHKV